MKLDRLQKAVIKYYGDELFDYLENEDFENIFELFIEANEEYFDGNFDTDEIQLSYDDILDSHNLGTLDRDDYEPFEDAFPELNEIVELEDTGGDYDD